MISVSGKCGLRVVVNRENILTTPFLERTSRHWKTQLVPADVDLAVRWNLLLEQRRPNR